MDPREQKYFRGDGVPSLFFVPRHHDGWEDAPTHPIVHVKLGLEPEEVLRVGQTHTNKVGLRDAEPS